MDRWENHNLAERQPLVVAKLRKQVRDFFSTDGSVGDAADEDE
jgi:hypothetical protein